MLSKSKWKITVMVSLNDTNDDSSATDRGGIDQTGFELLSALKTEESNFAGYSEL